MGRTETVIRRDVVVVADQPSEAVLEMDRPALSPRPSGSRRRPPIDIPQFLDAIRNLHSETFAQEVSGWFDELQSRGFDVVGIPSGIKVTAQVDRLTKPVSIFHLTLDGNVVDFGTLSYHISEKSGLGNAAFETMMHAIANSCLRSGQRLKMASNTDWSDSTWKVIKPTWSIFLVALVI